jgi:pyruvate,orthophosphate dikinase
MGGDTITIDGASGQIIRGEVATIQPEMSGDFATVMAWADEVRTLGVHANADTPEDARMAREFGAEGIGLCRTEHMFFETERIIAMREMILSEDEAGRRAALAKLLPMQRDDFAELFRVMKGLPVTIRLLDPPLNEFLPTGEVEMEDVAKSAGIDLAKVKARVAQLHEMNPMLGHRGCRLAISYPEVCEMQAQAMFEAALIAGEDTGEAVKLEVMVPLIATKAELDSLKKVIDRVAGEVEADKGKRPEYVVGTMIELPRAALRAGEIAETAAFFSFGTNDLTQTVYGLSRDDAASFIPTYEHAGILPNDPFASIDVDGVGELVSLAVERGRATRPEIKLGICGEHGGDPASVTFCHKVGLDYVSCSPFRVPIARLAAARAAARSR